jgi:TPR repeat protein
MKNLYGAVILVLLGIIGYQSGYLDKLFSKKSIDCNSKEAIELGKQIITTNLFPKVFANYKYNVKEINFNTIITKSINKDTGAQECRATVNILGNFNIKRESKKKEYSFFNFILGADKVLNVDNQDNFIISAPVFYTTEVTSDGKQYLVNLKFDGDRTKSLYAKNNTLSDEEEFNLILPFAKKGNANLQNRLGNMYYSGYGVAQDYKQAIYWYEKSANNGFHWGQYNLADMYYEGTGVEKNYVKAFNLFKKAAESNNYQAQTMLGIMFRNGEGTSKDYKKSLEYFEKSANQNFESAFLQLGYMYYDGLGVQKDYAAAFSFFQKASDLNNDYAKCKLAEMYIKAEGVSKNIQEAKHLLQIAYKNGLKEKANAIWENNNLDNL